MNGVVLYILVGIFGALAFGGVGFVFVSAGGDKQKKRISSVAKPAATGRATKGAGDTNQQRRKNVQSMLKELEAKQAEQKKRVSLRRRIEMAGLEITTKTFWIASGIAGL